MLKRLRRHLNPALVISVIALFAALSGGYALAFSGSGQLQKAKFQPPTGTFADARSVEGFGDIRLQCDNPNNDVLFEFENPADGGPSLILRTFEQNSDDYSSSVISDGDTAGDQTFPGNENTTFHIFRNDTSKAVATGSIATAAAGFFCTQASISVLNSVE
jgi:hypothetical protein